MSEPQLTVWLAPNLYRAHLAAGGGEVAIVHDIGPVRVREQRPIPMFTVKETPCAQQQ